jgi:glycosyltransferase involved in cell wall biosynthesis
MKLLWICGLPFEIQQQVLGGQNFGAYAAWSWVMGHLPPPQGVELHIACRTSRHTKPQEFDYRGAHFHLVPVKARARILCLFQFDWLYFRALAKRLQPEVIHGWGTEDAYAHIALRLAPRHHLIQVQGNVNTYRRRVKMPRLTWLAALSERMALARARQVVAENDYSLNSARPMIQTPSVHVVEHPIREDFLTAPPSEGIGKQIIFVGAIDDRKGIWDALEAFRAGGAVDWKLHIIGNGPSREVAELQRRIAAANFAGRVRHSARLDSARIVAEMQRSSLFLLPTKIDTGPTALKEAMAMGLWPICYDNSGPANYIKKFQYGTLAEDLNVAALTRALQTAIAKREWEASQQREKIATQIRPHFSRERIWVDLLNVYRQVRDESTRPHEK